MTAYGLTPRQSDLMTFLADYIREHKHSPKFDEMRDHLGLKSKSGIDRLLTALEERGYVCRIPNKARSISIAQVPA
jgi:repressor LexA